MLAGTLNYNISLRTHYNKNNANMYFMGSGQWVIGMTDCNVFFKAV